MTSAADARRQPDVRDDDGDVDRIARAVECVRRATTALVSTDGRTEDLAGIARRIHALADDLASRAPSAIDRMDAMGFEGRVVLHGAVVGAHNAIAPPVRLTEVEGGLDGSVTFSAAYERAPGVVHEGVVAMILDVALAEANRIAAAAGMTAQLNIRFHQPVPSGRQLTIRSRLDRVDGRKAYPSAEIWRDDVLLVTSDGLFISRGNRVTDA